MSPILALIASRIACGECSDVSIVKVNNSNDVIEYSPIDNEEVFDFVVNKIFLDFKEDVVDFATEQ